MKRAPLSPAIGGGWTRPHPSVLRDRPHWVYRLYDENNDILYVGCTYLDPIERIQALRQNNGTIHRAAIHHWKAQQYPDMTTALAVEGLWIDLINPPLNGMRSGVTARYETNVVPPVAEDGGICPEPWQLPIEERYAS